MKIVSTTDTPKQPMTARASAAYASVPVPSWKAIGANPRMVASDVIRIGRSLTRDASATASRTPAPPSINLRVKSTIRMLLEDAMPMSITNPMSDCTLSVVPVTHNISRTPITPIGTASRMSNGSMNDLH